MASQFERIELLVGKEAIDKLAQSRVAVFGIGGVGGYALEALIRSGIGAADLYDDDLVSLSNINRQIIASHKTIGRYKVDVAKERALDINPKAVINAHKIFYSHENAHEFDFSVYDYIIDAIDTVSSKVELIVRGKSAGVPVISSMGAGNKMDPTKFLVDDIYNTSVCPLAKAMRKVLKEKGIESLKVVYSKEQPIKPPLVRDEETGRIIPGSNAFVPPACGLVIASAVIKDLILYERKGKV